MRRDIVPEEVETELLENILVSVNFSRSSEIWVGSTELDTFGAKPLSLNALKGCRNHLANNSLGGRVRILSKRMAVIQVLFGPSALLCWGSKLVLVGSVLWTSWECLRRASGTPIVRAKLLSRH